MTERYTPPGEVRVRFEILDESGQPFHLENLPARRVLAGEDASSALMHARERATGRDWWVMLRATPVVDTDGKPELAINLWHDVTAEHREAVQAKYLANATTALGTSLAHDEMLAGLASVLLPGMEIGAPFACSTATGCETLRSFIRTWRSSPSRGSINRSTPPIRSSRAGYGA